MLEEKDGNREKQARSLQRESMTGWIFIPSIFAILCENRETV